MSVPAIVREVRSLLPAPTLLDRVIGAVSPARGIARLRARAAFNFLSGSGGYAGARSDRRATKEWNTRASSADSDQLPDATTLRSRSRDLVRNAPLATGAQNTVVRNTIGTGLWPNAQVDRDLLGLTDEQADAWERQAERLFLYWAGTPACDITGRFDFAQLTDLVCRSEFESGDVFVLRRFLEQKGDLFGTKLQLIEADRVCNPQFFPDTDRLAGGVELDENGAPIRLHYASRHPEDFTQSGPLTWEKIAVRGPKTGERQVLHILRPIRPGQTRGMPCLAPVIETLKQLDRYTENELMAAVISSLFTVFVKNENSGGAPQGIAGVETGIPTLPSELKLGNGAVVDLSAGESIEIADPKRPNEKFDPFVLACLRQIGAALELPLEVLILHFTSSYSAARAAFQEAWRAFITRRSRIATQFCQPSYEWVIAEAVARGHLQAPGFFESPLLRAAWCGAEWVGPSQGSLSPVDDATAAEKWLAMGAKTLAEVTSESSGGDWEKKHRQRVKEVRMRRRDGLDIEPVAERIVTEPRNPVPAKGAGATEREAEPGRRPEPTDERATEREEEAVRVA